MQALSSYSPDVHSAIDPQVRDLEDVEKGLEATTILTEKGWFARFIWPDWPEHLSRELGRRVTEFHAAHGQLKPIAEGTPDWVSCFHGWASDQTSAGVIANAFQKNFGERLSWVLSERDTRGRIAAACRISNLVEFKPFSSGHPLGRIVGSERPRALDKLTLWLTWKDSTLVPPGPLSEADTKAMRASTEEVLVWAGQRIRAVLNALDERLRQLYGERFRGIYVFGSYARPDAGIELPENSDLDVALILSDFKNSYEEIRRFSDISSDLELEHGLAISVVPVREADFKEGRTNFARVISSYAIPVKE